MALFWVMNLDLIIHNWRCFENIQLSLPDRSFVMVDDNGSGKTSILSAFYSLHTGQPWPTTKFSESLKSRSMYYGLITGYPDWSLTGQIGINGRLTNKYQKPSKNPLRESSSIFPRVFTYLPSDNNWLSMPRTAKLSILDNLLGLSLGQVYLNTLKQLNRYVKAKNELIKHTNEGAALSDMAMVASLSDQILLFSKIIWKYRKDFFEKLQAELPEFQNWIRHNQLNISVKYSITDQYGFKKIMQSDAELYSYNWVQLWQKELIIGKTMFGAQRDDFVLQIGQTNIENMFSRGEMRLLVLFVKSLTQKILLQNNQEIKTYWLLDDVLNELDDKRELVLFKEVLEKSDFYIITSTKKVNFDIPQYSVNDLTKK
jgi:DNA replication and repair protein RecF